MYAEALTREPDSTHTHYPLKKNIPSYTNVYQQFDRLTHFYLPSTLDKVSCIVPEMSFRRNDLMFHHFHRSTNADSLPKEVHPAARLRTFKWAIILFVVLLALGASSATLAASASS